MSSTAAVLRFVYAGAALKRGRVLELCTFSTEIPGRVLLDALSSDAANADLALYVPFFYSHALDGWTPLTADALVAASYSLASKRRNPSFTALAASAYDDDSCAFDDRARVRCDRRIVILRVGVGVGA